MPQNDLPKENNNNNNKVDLVPQVKKKIITANGGIIGTLTFRKL